MSITTFIWAKNSIQFSFRLSRNFLAKSRALLSNKVGFAQFSQFSSNNLLADIIDPSIRARFNPCIFLGEYMMRNNPSHGAELEYKELFETYAKQEKLRRFFTLKRQKIFKHFTLQSYHSNFTYAQACEYLKVLDEFLY